MRKLSASFTLTDKKMHPFSCNNLVVFYCREISLFHLIIKVPPLWLYFISKSLLNTTKTYSNYPCFLTLHSYFPSLCVSALYWASVFDFVFLITEWYSFSFIYLILELNFSIMVVINLKKTTLIFDFYSAVASFLPFPPSHILYNCEYSIHK